MSFLRKLVCVCTKLVCVCVPSLCIATCTATCSRPQQERQVHRRERDATPKNTTALCNTLHGTMSKRPCRLVCFCVLCVRSRSHAPALMLPSNTKPLCPTLCSSAGHQRVRSRSHAPLACSRYLFAPPYVCFRHSLAAEREGRVTIKRKLQVCVCVLIHVCVSVCVLIHAFACCAAWLS